MGKCKRKNKFFGKRKNNREDQENEKNELKKIKAGDDASNPQQSSEDSSEDDKEDTVSENSSEDGEEDTISENSSEENLSEEDLIKNLFDDALDMIRSKIDVEDAEIKKAYHEIKIKFIDYEFTKTDFNKSENLIAYFYVYSTFNANLSRHRFLDAFQNCQEIQDYLKKPSFKIISLGGGPGTDMIGFCSALQAVLNQQEVEDQCSSIKKLNITVVDKWKRWASLNNVMEFLIREGDYGNVSTIYKNIDICSSFMVIDLLSSRRPKKFIREIKTADIVLLVRVLDSFKFAESNPIEFIKKYLLKMKSGALLLVIDSVIKYYNGPEATTTYASDLGYYEMNIYLEKIGMREIKKSSKPYVLILKKN